MMGVNGTRKGLPSRTIRELGFLYEKCETLLLDVRQKVVSHTDSERRKEKKSESCNCPVTKPGSRAELTAQLKSITVEDTETGVQAG